MAHAANNTKLFYRTGTTPPVAEIDYLMEVPELGGTPEKIDVTTLSDKAKKYIPGMKDYGDLVFKFLYDSNDGTANFRILKDMEAAGEAVTFVLFYPDETAHQFEAIPSVKLDAGAINGALTFSATMMLQGDGDVKIVDDFTPPATA